VGREIPETEIPAPAEGGSIVMLAATDAPLLPHQLDRVARRCALGLALSGSTANNGSGDLFLAFSTANEAATREEPARRREGDAPKLAQAEMLPNARMDALFGATVDAVDEAIVNALVAAETMEGFDGRVVRALPHDRVREILARNGRLGTAP
jgi:L-aminopeptidase/D-esterase-like protein